MTLLLHAISASSPAQLDAGLRGQPLARIEEHALVVWATAFPRLTTLHREDLLAHHALIERLHAASGAVLPARVPTWLADEDAARAVLDKRHDELVTRLAYVQDRVELAVSLIMRAATEQTTAPTPGRRYMLERQRSNARRDAAKAIAQEIESSLASEAVEIKVTLASHAGVAASMAILADRSKAANIRARLAKLRTNDDVRILVNGPWPPYTFATLGERRETGVGDPRR